MTRRRRAAPKRRHATRRRKSSRKHATTLSKGQAKRVSRKSKGKLRGKALYEHLLGKGIVLTPAQRAKVN